MFSSNVIACHAFPLHHAQDRTHPFVQHVHAVYTSHHLSLGNCLGYQIDCQDITVLVFE